MKSKTTNSLPEYHNSTNLLGDFATSDELLMVIVDERTGREYYCSPIDILSFRGREYIVVYNYEPEDGKRRAPELVIMRSLRQGDGQYSFTSVQNKQELNLVFDFFFERFVKSHAK